MNAIVIGATQGLGLALVSMLLENGHRVAAGVVERSTPPSLLPLCKRHGDRLKVFSADVVNEAEIRRGAVLCKEFFGKADCLCNVAGILLPGDRVNRIHQCDVDELRKTFEINAFGAVIVAKNFYPILKKGGRLFTATSEGSGIKNCGTWVPCYGLSKTAATKVSGMFNAAVDDVDFFAVHPGRMNTDMGRTTAQIEPEESAGGFYRMMSGKTALSRSEWYIDYNGNPMDC